MADFTTHFFTATATGAVYATMATKGLGLTMEPALLLAAMTAAGGVLPDIDLKDSTPSKTLFLVLGALTALSVMMYHAQNFSVLELLIMGSVLFIAVRYPLWALFHQFTVHRGSLHSLTASAMFGMIAVVLCYRGFGTAPTLSWLAGIGVLLGSITHLLLDEIYSVDFSGVRIKRSFGTALKVIDTERKIGSFAVIVVTILSLWKAPPAAPLFKALQAVDPNWKSWVLQINF